MRRLPAPNPSWVPGQLAHLCHIGQAFTHRSQLDQGHMRTPCLHGWRGVGWKVSGQAQPVRMQASTSGSGPSSKRPREQETDEEDIVDLLEESEALELVEFDPIRYLGATTINKKISGTSIRYWQMMRKGQSRKISLDPWQRRW